VLNILILGCGNIGAMYDWDNEHVLTHAKAFSLKEDVALSFFDIDYEQAKRVAQRYNGNVITNLETELLNGAFDILSICTPTKTHFEFLSTSLNKNIPIIICEKPISNNEDELDQLKAFYTASNSKVIVNYIRRFQPAFYSLKNTIEELTETQNITNISIRYQRGLMNNCSHAFDLLQFLFKRPFEPNSFTLNPKTFDHFTDDPTVSGMGEWLNANVNVLGLQNVSYAHFEIDLYFTSCKVQIRESGDTIDFFKATSRGRTAASQLVAQNDMRMTNCMKNYMLPVANQAISILNNGGPDNFNEALQLNKTLINILNK
jgi:predicted dehydrogenase